MPSASKPHGLPVGSKHTVASTNGAKAATGAQGPFWASWGDNLNNFSRGVGTQGNKFFQDLQANTKQVKWPKFDGKFQMPVRVDVDFLNPFILAVRKNTVEAWARLPAPVQLALPYAAVGFTSSLIVYKIEHGKLVVERAKNKELNERVAELVVLRDQLQLEVKELQGRTKGHNTASEMQMAAAVTEATQAAAAAASAAASAASACSLEAPRHGWRRKRRPPPEPIKPPGGGPDADSAFEGGGGGEGGDREGEPPEPHDPDKPSSLLERP